MSARDFEVCKKCGGTMERVSAANMSPLIMECEICGHREWAEIQISPPWPIDKKGTEYARVIVYRTEGPAIAKEIRALRKLNQKIGRLPMHEAAKKIGSSQTIDLGVYRLNDAQDLFKKATAWGLKAMLEIHDENSFA